MTCEKGFFPTTEIPVVTIGAIGPSGISAFFEAPAGLSLSSQRVRLKLSTSTQGSMHWQTRRIMESISKEFDGEFLCIQCFLREENWKAKGRKTSIHFNGSDQNIELLDMCNELSRDLKAFEEPKAPGYLDKMEIPTGPSIAEIQANEQQPGKLLQQNFGHNRRRTDGIRVEDFPRSHYSGNP